MPSTRRAAACLAFCSSEEVYREVWAYMSSGNRLRRLRHAWAMVAEIRLRKREAANQAGKGKKKRKILGETK